MLVKDLYVGFKTNQKNEYENMLSKMIGRIASTTKVKKNLYISMLQNSDENLDV
jgi:hypothetical protein